MPSLPKQTRKRYEAQARRPTGERDTYNNTWANVSRLYRIANPLCEMCLTSGTLTDASPGGWKGVTDHIVRVSAGGARMDDNNFMTLCKPCHDRKSALERLGWTCDRVGSFGNFIPANKEQAIKTLIKK